MCFAEKNALATHYMRTASHGIPSPLSSSLCRGLTGMDIMCFPCADRLKT